MLKGVIFDLGSTLIRFDGQWPEVQARGHRALLERLQAGGLNLDGPAFLARYLGLTQAYYRERENEFIEYTSAYLLRETLREFDAGALPEPLVAEALEAMYRVSEAEWSLMPGVHAVVDELLAAAYRLAIISNAADEANVQRLIDNADLRRRFDPIVVSSAVGIRKPDPRIFDIVLRAWGIAPHEAAVVGDTLGADILGARNAGLRSIWLTVQADHPGNAAHLDTLLPDATAASLSDIPAILRGWT